MSGKGQNKQQDAAHQTRQWYAVAVGLNNDQAGEAVEYALMEAGAGGTETIESGGKAVKVTAYFKEQPSQERIHEALTEALLIYGFPPSVVAETESYEVAERDWLAEWKRNWQPVTVGQRFLIAPPWSEVQHVPDQIVIRIEPGMAFGTGTHETTRLCLAAIEKHFRGGSFLDVGTGTGILAIAAAKLAPSARIEACDTDAEAVMIAIENALLNEVDDRINFRVGTVETYTPSADCVCANLTADVILPLLPRLLAATCSRLILSGILDHQTITVQSRLNELGVSDCAVMQEGEWVAVVV